MFYNYLCKTFIVSFPEIFTFLWKNLLSNFSTKKIEFYIRNAQLNIGAFQCQHFFVTLFASIFCTFMVLFWTICIKFSSILASKSQKFMQKQHLLMVLFGMSLVINISTKISKKHHIHCTRLALFYYKEGAKLMHILVGCVSVIGIFCFWLK